MINIKDENIFSTPAPTFTKTFSRHPSFISLVGAETLYRHSKSIISI